MQKKEAAPRHCFICQQMGHLQHNCPNMHQDHWCFECGRWGHRACQCWQENNREMPVRGNKPP